MSFLNQMRRQKLLSFTLILFTLAVGVVIGTLINTSVRAEKGAGQAAPGATPLVVPSPTQLQSVFREIAKQVEPAVVNISTEYLPKPQNQARNRRRAMPQDEDGGDDMQDFFNRFFGMPGGPGGGGGGFDMPQRRGQALGSGVVVDKAGYLLTNNHVVEKADRIKVKFSNDPTEYEAKLIGADAPTDLAVLKIESPGKSFPAVKIGNSDGIQVGDWAIAIGSPFGFQATITAGIISAKEREVNPTAQFQHFLQTDAAINPGNSGGPLVNINGELIGINTAIATRSGGFQGVGFAMPINAAVKVYNSIIKHGRVTRGSIGISFRPTEASRDLLRAYGATEGVFVQSVAPGGPSEKAGIKAEDIIVAINGKPVKTGNELVERVTDTPVGNSLTITVLRDKKKQDFTVTVGDLAQIFPDRFGNGDEDAPSSAEAAQARFGITIENLTDARKQNLGLKETGGVLVGQVEPGSFAEDIGLFRGDVILAINRQTVSSVDDVKRIQTALKPGDAVAFRVVRSPGGRGGEWTSLFVAGTLPK